MVSTNNIVNITFSRANASTDGLSAQARFREFCKRYMEQLEANANAQVEEIEMGKHGDEFVKFSGVLCQVSDSMRTYGHDLYEKRSDGQIKFQGMMNGVAAVTSDIDARPIDVAARDSAEFSSNVDLDESQDESQHIYDMISQLSK